MFPLNRDGVDAAVVSGDDGMVVPGASNSKVGWSLMPSKLEAAMSTLLPFQVNMQYF